MIVSACGTCDFHLDILNVRSEIGSVFHQIAPGKKRSATLIEEKFIFLTDQKRAAGRQTCLPAAYLEEPVWLVDTEDVAGCEDMVCMVGNNGDVDPSGAKFSCRYPI